MSSTMQTQPSRRRSLTLLSALALTSALGLATAPVQARDFLGNTTVNGSGQSASVQRELAAFHKIAVNLNCQVEVVQGSTEGVLIEADGNLLPLIETFVKNGELTVQPAKGMRLTSKTRIKLTVNARNVDGLSLAGSTDLVAARLQSPKLATSIAGSGHVSIKDLQTGDLSISVAGNGRFDAQGTAAAMDVSIAGSGDINTARLAAQNVSISIAGSGDATVWARKTLSVSIVGAGKVQYYGEVTRPDSTTVGSGLIRQLGTSPPAI